MSDLTSIDGIDPDSAAALWHEVDGFRAPLLRIFQDLDAEVAELAPTCVLSGRCCRFAEYGHTLFLSAPEAALLAHDAGSTHREIDDGASCPWQDAHGHCQARQARPLGCRVYFCDPAYQDHAPPLTEKYLGRIKTLVNQLSLPWTYAPLHTHLAALSHAGLIFEPGKSPGKKPQFPPLTAGQIQFRSLET